VASEDEPLNEQNPYSLLYHLGNNGIPEMENESLLFEKNSLDNAKLYPSTTQVRLY
jgi:hypothetical protein